MDESDVVVDQGNYHSLREADESEISGHHAIYVGVHVPHNEEQQQKNHHHHHHKHRHKGKSKKNGSSHSSANNSSSTADAFFPNSDPDARPDALLLDKNGTGDASQRVKFILGDEADDGHESHEIFTEMEELCYGSDGEELEWKEMARWIKYEEDVDVDADRWSKPHVATLPLHSLFELRTCLINGTVCLDMEADNIVQIADLVLDKLIMSEQLDESKREQVREALLRKHHHQSHKKHRDKRGSSLLPMIRSLTDIGRSLSQGGAHNTSMEQQAAAQSGIQTSHGSSPNIQNSQTSPSSLMVKGNSGDLGKSETSGSLPKVSSHHSLKKRLSEARLSIPHNLAGHSLSKRLSEARMSLPQNLQGLSMTSLESYQRSKPEPIKHKQDFRHGRSKSFHSVSCKVDSPRLHRMHHNKFERSKSFHSYPSKSESLRSNKSDSSYRFKRSKARHSFMRKIPQGAEASNVLIGEVDFLSRPIIAFVRLQSAVSLGDLTEVPIPTRFLFILLGPVGETKRYHEIGRCVATLMSDKVFHDVAYKAKSTKDLLAGIDEFIDSVTVLPPGAWDPNIRIEPPKVVPDQAKRLSHFQTPNGHAEGIDEEDGGGGGGHNGEHEGLERTGKIFGGLIQDCKRRFPFYLSDFKDAFHLQCLASFIFMYFACITPVITFGGLLGEATENRMSALEGLLGASICGVAFHLFSGQPLTILGSTGPILVYEKILFGFCKTQELDYLSFRFWIGLWTMVFCVILVATDASSFVKYFTRFIEESFSSLISFIFIYESVHKLMKIYKEYPVARYANDNTTYECMCQTATGLFEYDEKDFYTESKIDCDSLNGTLVGNWCGKHVPQSDIFFMSLILMLGTFTIAYSLKEFKTTGYFPTIIRTTVSDFAVLIAVVIMVGVDRLFGVDTPKLLVPSEFKPTSDLRKGWFIHPFNGNGWWTVLAAIIPALLATILVFMDQQITAVIVNRKENKFKKGLGYHLDLLVVAVMLGICSIMGLPWFVAATVLSINHVNSLRVESECKAPGERPKIVGCREQRVTGVMVFVMIGLATLMTKILSYVPMPVLYGVFLFMGIASLKGVQFVDRLSLFFMPLKYQPDYIYLRHVGIKKVYLFTFIQLMCLVVLWVIKSTDAAIVFPIMVLGMVVGRKLMDYVFTKQEVMMLDDVMPEMTKRAKHDRKKKQEEEVAACEQFQFLAKLKRLGCGIKWKYKKGRKRSDTFQLLQRASAMASQEQPKMAKNGSAMKEKLKDEEPAYSPPPSSPKPTENLEETESIKNIPGRVQVPLSDGNMLSIPVDKVEFHPEVACINIPEDMAKTGVWKALAKNAEGGQVVHRKPHGKEKSSSGGRPNLDLPTIPGSPRESSYLETQRGSIQEVRIEVPEQFRRTPSPPPTHIGTDNETSV
ncbi:LOW QUALITY PROTEIN: electrogenic sodium bicarbonate cotransporter 1 [Strongylocentrotus purpuratus]|uniref:Anion exchange protein n=1 Tax=Strongylocentrotus purpuratus TaxID=7668 RepID=A0A7M7N2Y0_STRPU|nr:LOW QUALITY PROTEIN: electrogenic sodium bicarbonate cotransporter 1 [Strongylocentrotus purpuratus]